MTVCYINLLWHFILNCNLALILSGRLMLLVFQSFHLTYCTCILLDCDRVFLSTKIVYFVTYVAVFCSVDMCVS